MFGIIIIGSSLNMNTGSEHILVLSCYNEPKNCYNEPNLNRRKRIEMLVPNQVHDTNIYR